MKKTEKFAKIKTIHHLNDELISDTISEKEKSSNVLVKKITPYQLYIEKELLYRYFDYKKIFGKKWFFSSVENFYNKAEQL